MRKLLNRLLVPCLASILAAALPGGGAIVWAPDWEEALAKAASERKVVFVAVNMDGEVANDRMAQKVYTDPAVVAAALHTVNVVASRFDHSPEKRACARFGGIECIQHRRIEGAVRQNVLKGDAQGYVVAPQHVFLGPDKTVILSVPYEVTADELVWCFAAALKSVDPEAAKKIQVTGRAPRRLIQGDVFDSGALPGANVAPPSREEVLVLVKELRASMFGPDRWQKLLRVLMSPEPEAIDCIRGELKQEFIGRRGWINPGGDGPDFRDLLMHSIGVFSPPPYWKVVADYLDHDDPKLRHQAVVAIEQLAVPESVKSIQQALGKEKTPAIKKDLLRALGSAGASDDKAAKALLKCVATEKDVLLRRNAVLALGWLAPQPDVQQALSEMLAAAHPDDRAAAAVAMGISRHEGWIAVLQKAVETDTAPEFKPVADAAILVLQGAALSVLRTSVKSLGNDEIEREKFFGPAI